MAASELESNMSNGNLNKKKLFSYLDTSHANQPSTTKKIWFSGNLKKIHEKKCFKRIYSSHKSWSNKSNYVVKMYSEKLHLRVWFIACLNTLARAIARLSWKGLIAADNYDKVDCLAILKITIISSWLLSFIQKQPFADVLQNRCSWKFCNIKRKTLVLGSLIHKVVDLKDITKHLGGCFCW